MKNFFIFQLLFLLLLVSCSNSKINVTSEFKETKPRLVALLPIKSTLDLRDARVALLEQQIRSELKLRGYTLVEEAVVKKICPTYDCKQVAKLFSNYGISAYVQAEIESFSRNNFGLGFYNTISGNIKFFDRNGKELLKVARSEKEKGGLLFQSGQILQGLKEQFNNSGDDAFNLLAEKFSRELLQGVPAYNNQAVGTDDFAPSKLELVSMDEIKPQLYKICARSDSGSLVNLVFKRERVSLKSNPSGLFCRILWLNDSALSNNKIFIEARTAYGEVVRKDLTFIDEPVCLLDDKTTLARIPNKNELSLSIECKAKKEKVGVLLYCQDVDKICSIKKLVIYHSDSEIGPYTKFIEVNKLDKISLPKKPLIKKYLQVVTIGKGENYSLPVTLNLK